MRPAPPPNHACNPQDGEFVRRSAFAPELRSYAATLTDDVNAAYLLVHRTLTSAADGTRPSALKAWLKRAHEQEAEYGRA